MCSTLTRSCFLAWNCCDNCRKFSSFNNCYSWVVISTFHPRFGGQAQSLQWILCFFQIHPKNCFYQNIILRICNLKIFHLKVFLWPLLCHFWHLMVENIMGVSKRSLYIIFWNFSALWLHLLKNEVHFDHFPFIKIT